MSSNHGYDLGVKGQKSIIKICLTANNESSSFIFLWRVLRIGAMIANAVYIAMSLIAAFTSESKVKVK